MNSLNSSGIILFYSTNIILFKYFFKLYLHLYKPFLEIKRRIRRKYMFTLFTANNF